MDNTPSTVGCLYQSGGLDKHSFAVFIAQKRKAAGLTQEELAKKLYVTNTTVSKWERGLSFPDISLVPAVCRELQITEHEFFTACDDMSARSQQRQAKRWQNLMLGWQVFFYVCYGIAVLTCFICNLAVDHRLDWFFIVLASLALAFCFTSLPALVKTNRLIVCLSSATLCLLLLLLSCGLFTGGGWLGVALGIVAACLALPWGLYALWRFYGKRLVLWSMALLTVWTYGLLAVICLLTHGNWLLSVAYPIVTLCFALLWAIFSVARWAPINGWCKSAVYAALAGFSIPLGTGLAEWIAGPGATDQTFASYFAWEQGWAYFFSSDGWLIGNHAIFTGTLAAALLLAIVGVILTVVRCGCRRQILPSSGEPM